MDFELSISITTSARPVHAVGVGVVGAYVGDTVGVAVGDAEGWRVGVVVGRIVGCAVGVAVDRLTHFWVSFSSQGR